MHRLFHRILWTIDRKLALEISLSIALNRWTRIVTSLWYLPTRRPDTDADQLRSIADKLDAMDRATLRLVRNQDGEGLGDALGLSENAAAAEVGGGIQIDLRRIADRLEALDVVGAALDSIIPADMAATAGEPE